jgi:hypothetical protein
MRPIGGISRSCCGLNANSDSRKAMGLLAVHTRGSGMRLDYLTSHTIAPVHAPRITASGPKKIRLNGP